MNNILIVGLGLMGGSIAKGLKESGNYHLGGNSLNKDDIEYAYSLGYIDEKEYEISESSLKKYDTVILCLYPQAFIAWMKENASKFKQPTFVLDICGVKSNLFASVEPYLNENIKYVSTHPMAGREKSGIEHLDNTVFNGANFIIVPNKLNSEEDFKEVEKLAKDLKFGRISYLDEKSHDNIIGYLSQLTHVIAMCLMNCTDSEDYISYTGDSFNDLTRIASLNENMWSELFIENKENLTENIDLFINELEKVKELINEGNMEELKELMRNSTKKRELFQR